jgi:hypothetical protein
MICIEHQPKGFCLHRQGEVLNQEIIDNPDLVEDRHFCRHKKGKECQFNIHFNSKKENPFSPRNMAKLAGLD